MLSYNVLTITCKRVIFPVRGEEMGKKPRLGLYFENSEIKRRLVIAAAKRGISPTAYCTRAIEEQLVRDGILGDLTEQKAFIAKIDKIREEEK
jgi:hypothetical protein